MNHLREFPEWIVDSISKNHDKVNPKSRNFFEKLIEIFPDFDRAFLSIPATADIGILHSYDPEEIQRYYGLERPHEFILLNISELFHFQAVYQLRELGLSLLSALAEGRFYVSAITSRAILEIVCVNYFTFRRVENQFKQCLERVKGIAKTKSNVEQSRLMREYNEGVYTIFTKLFEANIASSIDWSKYLDKKFNIQVDVHDEGKKLQVLTVIEDLEKPSGLPLSETYKLLSEFVHPNAGSKMLVVNTKRPYHSMMDALTIGDNRANTEAALFYVDHVAEGMYYGCTLALTFFHRSQKLIGVLDQMVPGNAAKNLH